MDLRFVLELWVDLLTYNYNVQSDPSKARGIDGIGPRLLSTCALALYPVIHHLFNICLWYCQIPYEWKLHCIVPIFKSGDKTAQTKTIDPSHFYVPSQRCLRGNLFLVIIKNNQKYISFSVRFFERSLLPATATYVPAY